MYKVVENNKELNKPIESEALHYVLASYVYQTLLKCGGNVVKTAEALKVTHQKLRLAMKRYGIINVAKGSIIEWPYDDRLKLATKVYDRGRFISDNDDNS